MMPIVIEIADVPPSGNQLLTKGWRFRWRLGKVWQEYLFYGVTLQQRRLLERAKGKKRLTMLCRRLRVLDADNSHFSYKVILDAGTRLGWWLTDGPEHVVLEPPVQERASRRADILTKITIEVIP